MQVVPVTSDKVDFAVDIHSQLFTGCTARANYEESVAGLSNCAYYLVYNTDGTVCVGTFGIYNLDCDKKNAWLGWFGVVPDFRRLRIGTQIMKVFENVARQDKYLYARLYTDAVDNDAALRFYESCGYTFEPYTTPDDKASLDVPVVIGSKALFDMQLPKWNNKNIHLTEQLIKQEDTWAKEKGLI